MTSLEQITRQYRLTTDWYLSVLEEIKDQDGNKVISENGNSLEWLAGHLVVGRYRNIARLGVQPEPYKYLGAFVDEKIPPPNAIAFDKNNKYPKLSEFREHWVRYSKVFLDRLNSIDEKTLKTEMSFSTPIGGKTVEDALTFLSLHESFHIGQMSIIRKTLGYKAMQIGPRK